MYPHKPGFTPVAVLAALAAALLNEHEANAFDYVEHSRMTQAGVDAFLGFHSAPSNAPPRALKCDALPTLPQQEDCKRRTEWLSQLGRELGSTRVCPSARFLNYAPPGCFSASDIPALAGDHSSNVMTLKWRWFNDAIAAQEPAAAIEISLQALSGLAKQNDAPDTVNLVPPDISGFLRFVRRHQSRSWPVLLGCQEGNWSPEFGQRNMVACASSDTTPSDTEFLRYDSSYGALALRGLAHFRPATCRWDSAPTTKGHKFFASSRQSDTSPGLNAFAWYADHHTGAAAMLTLAATETNNAKANSITGAALILEFYGLHFLEDAIAAGHMQGNASRSTNIQLNAIHDMANLNGVVVKCPPENFVHRIGQDSALQAACASKDSVVRIHGDHYLAQSGMDDLAARMTFEWGAGMVQQSLAHLYTVKSANWSIGSLDSARAAIEQRNRLPSGADDQAISKQVGLTWDAGNACRDLAGYRRLTDWSVDTSRTQNSAAVESFATDSAFKEIMQNFPMPANATGAVDSQVCSSYAGANSQLLVNDFGGWMTELAFAPTYHPDARGGGDAFGARLRIGQGLALPPRMFPAQLQLGMQWDMMQPASKALTSLQSAQLYLNYRQLFGVEFGLFVDAQIGGGAYVTQGGDLLPRATWAVGLGYLWRKPHHQFGFQANYGFDPAGGFGWSAGVVFAGIPK
jgi:hypothetical protein